MWRRARRACRQRTFAPSETGETQNSPPDRVPDASSGGEFCAFRVRFGSRSRVVCGSRTSARRSGQQQGTEFGHGGHPERGLVTLVGVAEAPLDEDHRDVVGVATLDIVVPIADEDGA